MPFRPWREVLLAILLMFIVAFSGNWALHVMIGKGIPINQLLWR